MTVDTLIYKSNTVQNITLKYLVYLPADYESSKGNYPLTLFLHGVGERGNNLDDLKRHGIPKCIESGKEFPFIVIAPQCPEGVWWSYRDYIFSLTALTRMIIKKYRVDSDRVYGTGLSMGGFGVLAMAIQDPDLFSAIVPICGGADINKLQRLSNLPIWLFHGLKDDVCPVESSILIYKILKKVNLNIKLKVYDNLEHDSWTKTYENNDVYEWLMSHTK